MGGGGGGLRFVVWTRLVTSLTCVIVLTGGGVWETEGGVI